MASTPSTLNFELRKRELRSHGMKCVILQIRNQRPREAGMSRGTQLYKAEVAAPISPIHLRSAISGGQGIFHLEEHSVHVKKFREI